MLLDSSAPQSFDHVYNTFLTEAAKAGVSSSQIAVLSAIEKWQTFLNVAATEEDQAIHLEFLKEYALSDAEEYKTLLADRKKTKEFPQKLAKLCNELRQHVIAVDPKDPKSCYRLPRDPVSRELVDDINAVIDRSKPRLPAQFTNFLVDLIHYESRAIAVKYNAEVLDSPLDTTYHGRISRIARKEELGNRANIEITNALPFLRTLFHLTQLSLSGKAKVIALNCEDEASSQPEEPATPRADYLLQNSKARFESILNGLYAAHDFFDLKEPRRFLVSEIPLLPPLPLENLREEQAVTKAVLNWLFFDEPVGKLGNTLLDPKKTSGKSEKKTEKTDETQDDDAVATEASPFKTLNDWIAEASLHPSIKTLRSKTQEAQQIGAQMVLYNQGKSSLTYWKLAAKAFLLSSSRSEAEHQKGCNFVDKALHILDLNASSNADQVLDNIRSDKIAKHLHSIDLEEELFHVSISDFIPDILDADKDDEYDEDDEFMSDNRRLIEDLLEIANPFEIGDTKLFHALVKTRFGTKSVSKQQILQLYFESVPIFHEEFLQEFFEKLPDLDINALPDVFWSRLKIETGATDQAIDGIKRVVARYTPIDIYALPDFTASLSNPMRLLSSTPEYTMGVSEEAQRIMQTLNTNGGRSMPGIVVVKDESRYEYTVQKISVDPTDDQEVVDKDVRRTSTAYRNRVIERLARDVMMVTHDELNSRTILASVCEPTNIPPYLHTATYLLNGSSELNIFSEKEAKALIDLLVPTGQDVTLVINADNISNPSNYSQLLRRISDIGIKCIVFAKESIPFVKEITLERYNESSIYEALHRDKKMLQGFYGIKDFDDSALEYACSLVMRFTPPNENPMEYATELVHRCCEQAKQNAVITHPDVLNVASEMFRLPSPSGIETTKSRLERAKARVKLKVIGQDEAIDDIFNQIEKQLTGQNEPGKPLSFLLAGPTGVGKTELVEALSQELGLPYMKIPGSMYSESHTVSRFTGSPPGYAGADEGELFLFLKKNPECLVFVDEWEKMHPDVQLALMDVFDKGEITSGIGQTIKVPGLIGFGATNAGAGRIRHGMSYEELVTLLGTELVKGKQHGATEVPELVARFNVIVFPGVTEEALRDIFKVRLPELVQRGFWAAKNVHIQDIAPDALDLFVAEAKKRCSGQKAERKMGFPTGNNEVTLPQDRYYNLRQIKNVITALTGKAIVELEAATTLSKRSRYDVQITLKEDNDSKAIAFVLSDDD